MLCWPHLVYFVLHRRKKAIEVWNLNNERMLIFGWIIPLMHCWWRCIVKPSVQWLHTWNGIVFMTLNRVLVHEDQFNEITRYQVYSQSGSPQEPNTARINRMYTHTFIKNTQTHTLWRSDDYVHISSSYRHRRANECQAMEIINNYSKRECSELERRQELLCCGTARKKSWCMTADF